MNYLKLDKKGCLQLISLLFLLTSCSFLKSVKNKADNTHDDAFFVKELQNDLNRLCFNSDGKGRVQIMDEKYLFSFESLHIPKDGVWKLAIDFPMAGQEVISFGYKDIEKGKLRLGGSFYQRLRLKGNEDWKLLFRLLARFFKWVDDNRVGDMSSDCVRDEKKLSGKCSFIDKSPIHFDLKDGLSLTAKRKGKIFTLKSQNESDDGYYKRLTFSLGKEHDFGPRSMQFQLDLFLNSCSEPLKF